MKRYLLVFFIFSQTAFADVIVKTDLGFIGRLQEYGSQLSYQRIVLSVGGVVAGAVAAYKFCEYLFSTESYYRSAQKICDEATLGFSDDVITFDDIVRLLEDKKVRGWRSIIFSDTYVADVFYYAQRTLRKLSFAQEYIAVMRTRKNCDSALSDKLDELDAQIAMLQPFYGKIRSICESHSLFAQHMKIFKKNKRIRAERLKSAIRSSVVVHV